MTFEEWWNINGQSIYDAWHGNKFRDEGAKVLWQAAQENAEPKWRLIETAPKDGEFIGYWERDTSWGVSLFCHPDIPASLVGWLPLPEPPEGGGE